MLPFHRGALIIPLMFKIRQDLATLVPLHQILYKHTVERNNLILKSQRENLFALEKVRFIPKSTISKKSTSGASHLKLPQNPNGLPMVVGAGGG